MGNGDRGEGLIPLANSTRGRDFATVPASGSSTARLVGARLGLSPRTRRLKGQPNPNTIPGGRRIPVEKPTPGR